MNLLTIAKNTGHKVLYNVKKASPQIRTVVGIGGFFVAAVMVAKKSRNLNPIIDKHNEKIKDISNRKEEGTIDKKQAGAEYAKAYGALVVDLTKLYWQPMTIMSGSTILVLSSTSALTKSLSSTTAALAALDEKFKKAEERTTEKYGKDVADEIFYGIKKELVTTKEIDPETGEEKDVVEEHVIADKDSYPLFTRFFDSASREYEKNNPIYNYHFLDRARNIFQNKLNANDFVTCNELLEHLGFDKLKDEYGMDWGYEPGDIIDFGLDDCETEADRRFLNGYEGVYLIRFKGMHPLRKDLKKAYSKKV